MTSRHPRPILLVCLAFGALVLAFGSAIASSEYALRHIGNLVDDITRNANPSVLHLVRERNALWNLELELHARRAAGVKTLAQWNIEPLLARQDEEWRVYDSTPQFEGESELRDRVLPRIGELEKLLRTIVAAAARGDRNTVDRLIDQEAPAAFRTAADGLMELIVLNHQDGHEAALKVEETRKLAAGLAWGLGVGAVLLSIVLTVVVVRALQRTARLRAERDGFLEQRAVEHEMFAARVAHDIRAPLATAQLWIERARRHPDDAASSVDKLDTSLKRAAQIVDDLYAFARAHVAHRGKQQTSLREAVKYAVDEVAPRAATAGIELTTTPVPEATVAAAPGVVASVLSNLLSNAVKYAGRGARVTVQTLVGDCIRVNIADTGAGIPKDIQTRIFEPYVRGSEQDKSGGLGLGLATVKQLVERNGGACGVESKQGAGSTFWFELPRLNSSRPAPA